MWTAGSGRTDRDGPQREFPWRFLAAGMAAVTLLWCAESIVWGAEPQASPALKVSREQAERFVDLLRQQAQTVLREHRQESKWSLTTTASLTQGYESNVALDGNRRGDHFTQETLGVNLLARWKPWLRGRFRYDLFSSHYLELRDFNIWMNTVGGTVQWLPHRRASLETGLEYAVINFPFNTDNSFFDTRLHVAARFAQNHWLTHRTGWRYQFRDFDTRKASDAQGNAISSVNREDHRHAVFHEFRLRFQDSSVVLLGEYFRNQSNDRFEDFYDWDNFRIQSVLAHPFSEQWSGIVSAGYEHREYLERRVPNIGTSEKDDLYTFAGSLVYRPTERWQWRYSAIYRYQDSNDPRLDFTDWINELSVSLKF